MQRARLSLVLVLGLALGLRLTGINTRPIWYDEAFSILYASHSPLEMFAGTVQPDAAGNAADIHPLGYYTLLWGWMKLFGSSLPSVRSLSVLLGLALVLLVYALVSRLATHQTGLLAAALAALAPFQIHYAQEIRMYILLAAALLGATLVFLQAMRQSAPGKPRRAGWRTWAAFSLLAALAQYVHVLAAVYLLALALIPLLERNWPAVRRTFLAGLGAILLYLPWLAIFPAQFAKVRTAYWTVRPGPERLLTTLLSFVTNLPLSGWRLIAGLFVTLFLVAVGAWQTWRALRRQPFEEVQPGLYFAWLAFAPPLFLLLLSQWQPVYIERVLLPSGALFLCWLAWVLARTQLPVVMRSLLLILFVAAAGIGIYQHLAYRDFPYANYEQLGKELQARLGQGERVVHASKLTMLPLFYYHPRLPQEYLADPPGSGADTLALPTQKVLGLLASPTLEAAVADASGVWFVVFERELEEYNQAGIGANPAGLAHPALVWLESHFQLAGMETDVGVQLYHYVR